jgi:predicted nuclease of predicted toxin-antitoxin system
VKFLLDRCAGHRLAEWLRVHGHDVVETRDRSVDPGDEAILAWAAEEDRVLVTIDTDFGRIIFAEGARHCGWCAYPTFPPRRASASLSRS